MLFSQFNFTDSHVGMTESSPSKVEVFIGRRNSAQWQEHSEDLGGSVWKEDEMLLVFLLDLA